MENKLNKCVDELKEKLINRDRSTMVPVDIFSLNVFLNEHKESLRKIIEDEIDEIDNITYAKYGRSVIREILPILKSRLLGEGDKP